MSTEDKIYVKIPIFGGRKSKWNIFKTKYTSCLAQKGMSTLLTTKASIPKDDVKFDLTKDDEKEKSELIDMNIKAYGLLLSCIETETAAGESAFAIVEQYQDAAGGYAGGNFPDAWKSLEKRYEDKDTIDVADLKQAYYDIKITKNEKPSFFIDKLKKMRKRLANEMNYVIDDKQFMLDTLAKMPKSKEKDGVLGPYQIQR